MNKQETIDYVNEYLHNLSDEEAFKIFEQVSFDIIKLRVHLALYRGWYYNEDCTILCSDHLLAGVVKKAISHIKK